MKIGLESFGCYLPGEQLDLKEYYAYLNPEIDKLPPRQRETLLSSAPDSVRRLKDPSALEHMALSAARLAMDNAQLAPADIDGLLVAQSGGKQFMPLMASYLQLNLGLSTGVLARNIGDNGVSVPSMMNLARLYVQSGICKRVLIVTSAAQIGGKYGFGADLTEPWCIHLGDGAAAAVVSAQNIVCEILGFHMETYAVSSRKTGTLNADYGPVRPPKNRELCFAAEMDDRYGAYLVLDDPKLLEVAGEERFLSGTVKRGAEKAGLATENIDHVITSHVAPLFDVWKKDMSENCLSQPGFPSSYKTNGRLGCADVLFDLAVFSGAGAFSPGETTALWTVCPGVQAAMVFLRWIKKILTRSNHHVL